MAFKVRSIKFNFLMNLILTGSSLVFPLITFPIVSRALLADAYGAAGFALSAATWVSLIAMLGVNRYGIREVAKVRDDAAKLAKVTREILLVTVVSTVIVLVCYIALMFVVPRLVSARSLLLVTSVTVVCNTLGVNWFFQGIEQYSYITVRGVVVKLVCLVGVVLLVKVPEDCLVYAALVTLSGAAANLINFAYMNRILHAGLREVGSPVLGKLAPKRHLKPLMTFFVIVAAISIYTALDTVMLGFLSSDAQVGYYTAAVNVKIPLQAAVGALTSVLLPRASNMLAKGEGAQFRAVIRKCVYLVGGVSIPVCAVLAVVATPLLSWYAGPAFAPAGAVLSIICSAVVFIGMSTIFCDAVMVPLGLERYCTVIYIVAAVLDVVGNLILIPHLGAMGAAISTTSVEILIAVVEFLIIRKRIWCR